MHPNSGIATLTWQPGSNVQYEDTSGQNGILKAGGLEWMNAGGGAWHQGLMLGSGLVTAYIPPEQVPVLEIPGGRIRILLGEYPNAAGTAASPIVSYQSMNYLVAELDGSASWSYQPPHSHNVAWAFVFEGWPTVLDQTSHEELLVFDGDGAIEFGSSSGPSKILLGSGRRHDYPLVPGQQQIEKLGVVAKKSSRLT